MRFRMTLGLVLAMLLQGCRGRPAPPPIELGHVATLSGPGEHAGKQAERGILLAIQEQNAEAESHNERKLRVRHANAEGKLDAFGK